MYRFLLVSGILAHAIINKERGEAIVFNVKGETNVCKVVFILHVSPSVQRIPKLSDLPSHFEKVAMQKIRSTFRTPTVLFHCGRTFYPQIQRDFGSTPEFP